ncbi:MAG: site-specific DNA-methyltransferase [Desulfobacteraceae bacterium]|nr:site-specific DNA-methyltransferase [Desulfobacteraceae bacterium]
MLKIIEIETGKLIPYAKNSRTHSEAQIAQVAASIREFGFTNPILIDEKNSIIAGHGRVQAARLLELKKVPTITLSGLTDIQKQAYIIADNKLALNAGWDEELLSLELKELQEMDFDLELTGFDEDELDDLLNLGDEKTGKTDDDAVPDAPEVPNSRLGDIWIMGNHRLMCGDSTSVDAVESLVDGQKADMVFTDPPYGINLIKGASGKVGGGTKQYPTRRFDSIANDNQFFAPNLLFGLSEQLVIWGGNYCADKLPPSRCWFIWDKNHPIDRTFANCELAWTNLDRHSKVFHSTWDGYTKEGEDGSKVHPTQKPIKLFLYI